MSEALKNYEEALGQTINLQSEIYFSKNIDHATKDMVKNILQV